MLLNNKTGKHSAPPRQGHPSKHVIPIVSGVVVVLLVAGACVVTKKHFDHGTSAVAVGTSTATASSRTVITKTKTSATKTSIAGATATARPHVASPGSFTPPGSWPLTFDATFQGSQLDSQVWATCYPWATSGCTNFGNTSDPEQEWYQASQDQISGGALNLIAQREPTTGLNQQGGSKEYACRSGMATTYPSLRFEYGYLQITAQIPFGKGLWPAFWLAAANEQWPPEVDILEHWSSKSVGDVYLHPVTGARQGGPVNLPALSSGWHTFGLYWTKTSLVWYYDGNQIFATSTGVPQQAMYLIANLAVDDASPGGCSGSLLIKSVKVWQPPS